MGGNLLIEKIKMSRTKVHDILSNIDYYNENCIYPDDLVQLEQLLKFLEEVERYRNKKYLVHEKIVEKYVYQELEKYSEIELEGLIVLLKIKEKIENLKERIKYKKLKDDEIIKISEILIIKGGEL